jgi:23S rRNA (adenine2030-N6)-methyltransferase
MNYQHIYHAGNFADVLKHVILVEILSFLNQSKKPFFVLDTHAGRGRYNLKSLEAMKSGEYVDGIAQLYKYHDKALPAIYQDYISVVKEENFNKELVFYPGSPCIIRRFLRANDRATFCELNDKEFFKLHAFFRDNHNIKLINGDGYEALMSVVPPREKRGLVLIDPPFEQKEEVYILENTILECFKRWSQGIFMLWYPVKHEKEFNSHISRLVQSGISYSIFELSLPLCLRQTENSLGKTAIAVFNPPQELLDKKSVIEQLDNILFKTDYAYA